jgi:hypothetical protein
LLVCSRISHNDGFGKPKNLILIELMGFLPYNFIRIYSREILLIYVFNFIIYQIK